MIRTSFLTAPIKVTFSFAALLLISSSQSDCSSDIYPVIEAVSEGYDIGSCFTHHQNGYLPSLENTDLDKDLAVTGSKYHF